MSGTSTIKPPRSKQNTDSEEVERQRIRTVILQCMGPRADTWLMGTELSIELNTLVIRSKYDSAVYVLNKSFRAELSAAAGRLIGPNASFRVDLIEPPPGPKRPYIR